MEVDKSGVINLVCGVVKKAVDDWRQAKRKLRKNPASKTAEWMIIDCERFFLSEYFVNLTGMDGKVFLEKLVAQEEEGFRK